MTHEAVGPLFGTSEVVIANFTNGSIHTNTTIVKKAVDWLGSLDPADAGQWVDFYLLLIFGGIPWQVSVQGATCKYIYVKHILCQTT